MTTDQGTGLSAAVVAGAAAFMSTSATSYTRSSCSFAFTSRVRLAQMNSPRRCEYPSVAATRRMGSLPSRFVQMTSGAPSFTDATAFGSQASVNAR